MLAELPNLIAISIQVACIAVAAGVVSALLRVTAPGLRYLFWRAVLAICVALPWIQTPKPPSLTAIAVAAPAPGATQAMPTPVADAGIDWTLWFLLLIVCGIGVRLLWMAAGCLRLHGLRVAGVPAAAEEHADLQRTLRTRADVRYVDGLRQPVTFGIFRPVVLLPASLAAQPEATRHAVIAHELVHVCRRDWCWVVGEEIMRAALWFHPAMWWLISQIQHAREEVVDATVVSLTGRRREYLEALLAFADDVPLAPAPAFARRRHLFRRIVLLSGEEVMSARRLVASAVVMGAVLAASGWAAVGAFPMQPAASAVLQAGVGPLEEQARPVTPDNPVPTRVREERPVFPAEAAGENANVTVTLRTVVDHNGNVAEMRLGGLAFQMNGFAATLAGGPNTLKQLEQMRQAAFLAKAGDSRVSGDAIMPLLHAFVDAAATAVRQWQYEAPREGPIAFDIVVQFNTGKPVTARTIAPVGAASGLQDGAIRVGGNIRTPTKVKDVKPVYPPEARDSGTQGVVILELRLEADGRVGSARVLRSIPMLDQAAIDAVRQWEFTPTLLNGQPVPVIMTVTIQFSL